jgi:site-specific DNA-methyltransferase (adenine-specific)
MRNKIYGAMKHGFVTAVPRGDSGSAARFFYSAKATKLDREEGLGALNAKGKNTHPTVKPTNLMRWLCRLVTPPGGVVLDPFMGSGSTGKAAMLEGMRFVGCEVSEEFAEIAKARVLWAQNTRDVEGDSRILDYDF